MIGLAAKETAIPDVVFLAVCMSDSEKETKKLVTLLNKSMQYGASHCIPNQALSCELSLAKPSAAGIIKAYNINTFRELQQSNRLEETICLNTLPALVIKNTGNSKLSGLTMRIIVSGVEEKSFPINETIGKGKEISLDLADYRLNWHKDFRIEVYDQAGRTARINPIEDVVDALIPTAPPILAYWEKGFFGGNVLKLYCYSGTLTNVQLHKENNISSQSFELKEDGDVQNIGWCEMSDSVGLQTNTIYAITCNEADSILCALFKNEGDGGAGWTKAAAWVGGAAAAIFLGS